MLPTLKELRTKLASELSPEHQANEHRLHGTRPPNYVLTEERPWHRVAAYLFATGAVSIRDVARACDVTEPTVRNLLRQVWFQERVTTLMAENGGKDIMALFKAEQFNSLITLIELRDNNKTPAPVRANICQDILNRTLGKPIQRIETEAKLTSDDPVAEAHRLKDELARSRERLEET